MFHARPQRERVQPIAFTFLKLDESFGPDFEAMNSRLHYVGNWLQSQVARFRETAIPASDARQIERQIEATLLWRGAVISTLECRLTVEAHREYFDAHGAS